VFICSGRDSTPHEAKIAEETRKTGALVYAVSEKDEKYADITFSMNGSFEKELIALHFVFVMQSFAHFFSIKRGCDPDHPGDLIPFIMYQGA
jgi:fructoselysine-6-P-deglycase FrlB-like protein